MPAMVAPDRDRLFRLAARQAGHFTVVQAGACGFDRAQLKIHERSGTVARVYPGVFRFARYPAPSHAGVVAAWLAAGGDEVAVSHETALRMHGLSRRGGGEVHLTVPRGGEGRPALRGVVVHVARRRWRAGEVVQVEGMAVTAPARAIVDAAEAGASAQEVEEVIGAALDAGLATRKTLTDALRGRSQKVGRAIRSAIVRVSKRASGGEP